MSLFHVNLFIEFLLLISQNNRSISTYVSSANTQLSYPDSPFCLLSIVLGLDTGTSALW